jgi:putative alpha-1,2-mannosidase
MEGDPAGAILGEAVAFGCTNGLDMRAAAQAVVKGATVQAKPSDLGQGSYWERYYGPAFNADGYAPDEVSVSLQYSMDDYAAATVAAKGGLHSYATEMLGDSGNWIHTFDAAARLPAARNAPPPYGNARFQSVASVAQSGVSQPGFMEGNATQYLWLVPEHLNQLAKALGGDAAAARRLSGFLRPMMSSGLDATAQQPYYMASNEEDLWAPWEGDFFGDPALTERATTAAVDRFYSDSAAGLPGNDDAGEMSSWAFWAMIGLFPVTPGTATMAVGSPEFTAVTIGAGRHTVMIDAQGAGPDAPYVAATQIDGGGPLGRPSFELATGHTILRLEMAHEPAANAFTSEALALG